MHLGERECWIQRRHQKLLEEGSSAAVTEKMRRTLGKRGGPRLAGRAYELQRLVPRVAEIGYR